MNRHWNKINWLSSLIVKKAIGHIDKEENEELESILNNENILRSGNKYNETSYIAGRLVEETAFDKKKAYKHFCNKVKKDNFRQYSLKIYRYAAVVAIIIFASISYFVFTEKKVENYNAVTEVFVPNNNIILKLANGKELNLDLRESNLTEEDGTEMLVDSGQIIYTHNKSNTKELLLNEIKVPRGGEYFLKLADGTEVWINSESTIKYPVNFIRNKREVRVQGEAFFKVAKDSTRPFVVNTSMGKITVLGTEFNVRDYKEENKMIATLVEGSIKYTDKREDVKPRLIKPEYQIIASENEKNIIYKKVDVIEYVGWKDGLYVFKDKSLGDIMETIERWYNVNVFYMNADLKTIRFSGDLKRFTSINTLLDLMEKSGDVKFKIKDNAITVMKE